MIAIFLLVLTSAGFASESQQIAPGTAYRLTFEAKGAAAATPWAVHLRDAKGSLPFDGALEAEWQQVTPGQKTYSQLFYAPADATTFQLVVKDPGVTVTNIQLEKLESKNLVLNGDFSEGMGNYSGWSERYNAQLVERDGKPALRVNQNGYALTDYAPAIGGGLYSLRSAQGAPGAKVLAYDSLRRLVGVIERKPGKSFEIPMDAAYLRIMYATGFVHLATWRVNEIVKAELLLEEFPTESSPAKVEKIDTWEIVLAPGCDPRDEYAARDLQHWMTAITGKVPALLAEESKGNHRRIFLGRAWADSFTEDLSALEGSDGFAVRTKDRNVYVFGTHPRGTLYGVHALLERNTDIIWPRPNPEFAAILTW